MFDLLLQEVQGAVHLNPLYQQWNLLVGAGALLTFSGAPIYWLFRKPAEEVEESKLRLRALLTTFFQELVIDEARAVLELIDDDLPSALTGVDDPGGPSAFDRLAVGLREIDPEDPEPQPYRALLEQSLSGLLANQAHRLLDQAVESVRRDLTSEESPTGLRVRLTGETEQMLFHMAEVASELEEKESIFIRGQSVLKWSTPGMAVAVVFATGGMFANTQLAYIIALVFWGVFLLLWVVSFLAVARSFHGYHWLKVKAANNDTAEELIVDIVGVQEYDR